MGGIRRPNLDLRQQPAGDTASCSLESSNSELSGIINQSVWDRYPNPSAPMKLTLEGEFKEHPSSTNSVEEERQWATQGAPRSWIRQMCSPSRPPLRPCARTCTPFANSTAPPVGKVPEDDCVSFGP